MFLRHLCILSLLCSTVIAQSTTPPFGIRDKTPDTRAFTGARIEISPGNFIENGTLVIKDSRVIAVGTKAKIPSDAVVVDLSGRYIYPAFIDPMTEYGLGSVKDLNGEKKGRGPKYKGTRQGANSWNDAIHSERNWVEEFKADKKKAKEYIKLGFAVVQSSKQDGIFRGRSFVTLLGQGLENDLILNPYSLHFASFDPGTSKQEYPSSLMGSIALIRQTFLDLEWYQKAHRAFAIDPTQEMPEVNTAIEALSRLEGKPILFESEDELDLLRAKIISTEFNIPFIYVGSNYEYARIAEIKSSGATLLLPVDFPKTPEVKTVGDELDVSLSTLRHWDMVPTNAAVLEDNDVQFAFTTHRLEKKEDFLKNVRRAVKRGLSKKRALEALTTVPAAICQIADQAGTLELGMLANFIVSDTDIFESKAKIEAVWVRGVETEIDAPQEIDFRGIFNLQLENMSLSLLINGEIEEPKVRIISGDDTVKASNVNLALDLLEFSAKLDTFGLEGTSRFSCRKDGNNLRGHSRLPDVGLVNWVAFVDNTKSDDEAKDDSEEDSDKLDDEGDDEDKGNDDSDDPDIPIAHLTYPNIAYGHAKIPSRQDVLIKNATVWTVEDDGILENTDVLVENGKFSLIGKHLTAPKGVLVIDASGRHLTPGMIDEHSHIAITQGVNEGSHAITAEVRIGDAVTSDDISIYRALAGGTTTAQLLHGSANPIGGQAQVIKMRWGSTPEVMKFRAAPPSIKFALGENVKQSNWGSNFRSRYPQSRMGVQTIMKDGFVAAGENEAAWATYNALGRRQRERTIPPRRDLQLETLTEIKNSERFVHCHSYVQSEILMLMRLAESFGFRIGTFTHILEGYKVASEMAAHGAGGSTFSDWWAYKFEVYDAIPYNTCIMFERGVITSINSDSRDLIRRLNTEAAKSVQYCGMSQEDAIKLATINPAKQLKIDNRVGSIKVGKDADFVIWNNNPLSLYARVDQTWVDGTKHFDRETDARLRTEIAEERRALIQKALKSKKSKKDKGGKHKKNKHDDEYDWHCEDVVNVWKTVNR